MMSNNHKPSVFATTMGAISAFAVILLYSRQYSYSKSKKERKKKHNDGSKDSNTNTTTKQHKPSSTEEAVVATAATVALDSESEEDWAEHLPSHVKRELEKERRRHKKLTYLAMKKPMYDNIQMIDPKGETLAKISKKKAEWYISKGLANYVCTDTETEGQNKFKCIQLNFEPKDNSGNTIYHTADKENRCVKCGRGDYHLMRHHIVPSAYRTLLPMKFKSHMSHDITLLCGNCHVHCQQESQKKMNQIETLCRPPRSKPRYINNEKLYKLRSSALALLNWKHKIPKDHLEIHYKRIEEYLIETEGGDLKGGSNGDNGDRILPAQLQEIINIDYKVENPDFIPGPVLVVGSIIDDEEKIGSFIRSWRKHFLDTVHPLYLPDGWSVDHQVTSNNP